MATVVEIRPEPVPPPRPTYTLTMTEDEALIVLAALGQGSDTLTTPIHSELWDTLMRPGSRRYLNPYVAEIVNDTLKVRRRQ